MSPTSLVSLSLLKQIIKLSGKHIMAFWIARGQRSVTDFNRSGSQLVLQEFADRVAQRCDHRWLALCCLLQHKRSPQSSFIAVRRFVSLLWLLYYKLLLHRGAPVRCAVAQACPLLSAALYLPAQEAWRSSAQAKRLGKSLRLATSWQSRFNLKPKVCAGSGQHGTALVLTTAASGSLSSDEQV